MRTDNGRRGRIEAAEMSDINGRINNIEFEYIVRSARLPANKSRYGSRKEVPRRPLHGPLSWRRASCRWCDGSNTSGPQVSNSEMNATQQQSSRWPSCLPSIIITIIALLILSGQWPTLLSDLFDRYEMGKDELVSCDMLLLFFMDNVRFLFTKWMKWPRTVSVKYMLESTPLAGRKQVHLFCT